MSPPKEAKKPIDTSRELVMVPYAQKSHRAKSVLPANMPQDMQMVKALPLPPPKSPQRTV